MNKRIKELAEQAGWDLWEGRAQADMTGCETELQKFAELIVAECISYMEDGDIDFAKFMIKKNFGVEE